MYRLTGALIALRALFMAILHRALVPGRDGYQRGIDYYRLPALFRTFRRVAHCYHDRLGYFPNLSNPQTLNEKVTWQKFFSWIKVPESGNKLLTSHFIPDSLRDSVKCADIVWHSPQAGLPANEAIAPGAYYLKTNHGSGMFQRICYPLSAAERQGLEALCHDWLGRRYGLQDGEWWYDVFPREVLLEKDVTGTTESISSNFFVARGKTIKVVLCIKRDEVSSLLWLGPDLAPLAEQAKSSTVNILPVDIIDIGALAAMQVIAEEIGRHADLMRVDLLQGADQPVLGEITLSPGNGMNLRPYALDLSLGQAVVLTGLPLWRSRPQSQARDRGCH